MENLDYKEMWDAMGLVARLVVLGLGLMSMYSITIIAERTITYRAIQRRSKRFADDLQGLLKAGQIQNALARAEQENPCPPVAQVVLSAIGELRDDTPKTSTVENSTAEAQDLADLAFQIIERTKLREVAKLKKGLSNLATIGSVAPFVGLFGTVVGIINAFHGIASAGQGGLASVSAGIAEALVATALGLVVAIPAVAAFNYLSNRVEEMSLDIGDVGTQLVTFILRHGKAPFLGSIA